MPGQWITLPGGFTAHVRTSRRPRRRCSNHPCIRWATLECDYPTPARKSGTCDKPLCSTCAVKGGADIDYCPHHPKDQTGQQLGMDGL